MQQINPISNYSIVRQLDNVNDPATYYVRAVIKYSSNGNIYKTVNLVDMGGQRFVGNYISPQASQMGTQIDVTTYVYEDSSYTTLSQVYSTTNTQFLVIAQFSPSFGSGGGSSITIEQIEALLDKRKPLPPITLEDVLNAVEGAFGEKFGVIDSYLGYLSDGFEKIHGKVRKLIHKKDRTDEVLSIFGTKLSEVHEGLKGHSSEISERHLQEIMEMRENFAGSYENIAKELSRGRDDRSLEISEVLNELKGGVKTHLQTLVNSENKVRLRKMKALFDEAQTDSDTPIEEEKPNYLEMAKKFIS